MTVSVQVFDCTLGRSAQGVSVRLERRDAHRWTTVLAGVTGGEGALADLASHRVEQGSHRFVVAPSSYFAGLGAVTVYHEFAVDFHVGEATSELHLTAHISVATFAAYWRRG